MGTNGIGGLETGRLACASVSGCCITCKVMAGKEPAGVGVSSKSFCSMYCEHIARAANITNHKIKAPRSDQARIICVGVESVEIFTGTSSIFMLDGKI